MKVTAIEKGYYGGVLRYEGKSFEVPDGAKASWFVPDEDQPAGGKGARRPTKPPAEPEGTKPPDQSGDGLV